MEWIIIFLVMGFLYEIDQIKKRIDNLASKVYDLEENTVKKKQDWDL